MGNRLGIIEGLEEYTPDPLYLSPDGPAIGVITRKPARRGSPVFAYDGANHLLTTYHEIR